MYIMNPLTYQGINYQTQAHIPTHTYTENIQASIVTGIIHLQVHVYVHTCAWHDMWWVSIHMDFIG